MSVTIYWRPCSEVACHFESGTSNSFKILKEIFGTTINARDINILRAMAKAANDGFYNEVADKVEQVGAIEIWEVY